MENQIETQDVKDQDELENELDASAGYFVRTDLRVGAQPTCDTSRGVIYYGQNSVLECSQCALPPGR